MSASKTAEKKRWSSSFETFADENEMTKKGIYLSFRLAENDFGIEIAYIVEIIGMKKITQMPLVPVHIKGAIEYRGQMIYVSDLRVFLDLPTRPYHDFTFIVVINYQNALLGLIVDDVNGVRAARPEELIPVRSRYGSENPASSKA